MNTHLFTQKQIEQIFGKMVHHVELFLLAVIGSVLAWYLFFIPTETTHANATSLEISPELYNSAFSPRGASGGEIIPASCSLGYPWHIGEPGPNPCNPTITMYSLGSTPALTPTGSNYSVSVTGGGSVSFGYTSQYAEYCDIATNMSEPGMGFSMYYVENPSRDYYNLGPIANKNGWIHYQVVCRQAGDRGTAAYAEKVLYVNTNIAPLVKVSFDEPLTIKSFTGIDTDEFSGKLTWSVVGATSCSATGASGWSGSSISPTGGTKTVSYPGSTWPRTYSYTLTCTDGTDSVIKSTSIFIEGDGSGGGGGCFIAGTKVTMGDGSQKHIEAVTAGEILMTSSGPEQIERVWRIPYKGQLYAFNGSGNYFVTDSHPFMTTEGWKSFDPEKTKLENPGLVVGVLEVGDTLVREDGSFFTLEQVDSKYAEETVYNFKVSGETNDFYADGFLVHNAMSKL